jgi:exportin-2 (importin alpha re-exporter)
MLAVPPLVQRQISDALAHISRCDFPESWPTLMPDLVAQVAAAKDITALTGLLETAAAVFERFRGASADDEAVLRPLKLALDSFAKPLTESFRAIDAQFAAAVAAGAPKSVQAPLVQCLSTMVQIFYLLNCVDLPEFFEDNISTWMAWFHAYLAAGTKFPLVTAAPDDPEEGALESLQSNILECVALYGERYDEEFEAYFPTFVQDVWALAAAHRPEKLMSPNMDNLITRAIKFLSSVAGKASHAAMFKQDAALRAMFQHIIVPNLTLRAAVDVETFEDNPVDFIRGDIEGSNADTRRRVAADLVHSLCVTCNDRATPIAMEYAQSLIAAYEADKKERTVQKDAAVALTMAVAIKSSTESGGVTAVNELVSLSDFLNNHIFAELQPAAVNERPLAIAACLKFVATFRNLFGQPQLHALLSRLAPFLESSNFVVHTYAAAAIERILCVRDVDASGRRTPRVAPDFIQPILQPLLVALFNRIARPDYPENEYLMRCILRIVAVAKERIGPVAGDIIGALTKVLTRVCANPANPTFNHTLFETIASIMRSVCTVRPDAVGDFEALLFQPFQGVLASDVQEFLPYVFQLFAELLSLRPNPTGAGSHSLSQGFKALLPPCVQPMLWARKGSVPALTELLVAYVHKGAAFIAGEGAALGPLLGVWSKLMSTNQQEQFAFAILDSLSECRWGGDARGREGEGGGGRTADTRRRHTRLLAPHTRTQLPHPFPFPPPQSPACRSRRSRRSCRRSCR